MNDQIKVHRFDFNDVIKMNNYEELGFELSRQIIMLVVSNKIEFEQALAISANIYTVLETFFVYNNTQLGITKLETEDTIKENFFKIVKICREKTRELMVQNETLKQ
jgi:hypothetical protein